MFTRAHTAAIGVLVAAMPFGPVGAPPVVGQTPAAQLTTDTLEYCSHLRDLVRDRERLRPLPREAVALSGEGEMMCDHGQTRAGILRLRRAMRIIMDGDPP